MKKCKECYEMYDLPHPTAGWGQFRIFGDYCPKCGTFNSEFNKSSIIAFLIFILIGVLLYLFKLI